MNKSIFLVVFLIACSVLVAGCSSDEKTEFTVGNSSFQVSGGFEEVFNSKGAESAERIRLDSDSKSIIVTQFNDKELYDHEREYSVNEEVISGVNVFVNPIQLNAVFFEKNNKYYSIIVQGLDSKNDWVDSEPEDIKYIEEIISTIK